MDELLEPLRNFHRVFVPLLVAINPFALSPFLVSFMQRIPRERRGRVINLSVFTGSVIGLAFLLLGTAAFAILGITVGDFLIAGGLILLVVSLRELLAGSTPQPEAPDELVGIVPLGTPLLVGPAAISLLILFIQLHEWWLVVAAFLLNMALSLLVFYQADRVMALLGRGGVLALSRVAYLLLAAIAVQLMRRGFAGVLPSLTPV